MRYRVKEECGLCGKILLLQPHLKTDHNIKTWREYILKLKESKGKKPWHKKSPKRKETPSGGLNYLLKQLNPAAATRRKPRYAFRERHETIHSPEYKEKEDSPPRRPQCVEVPYTEEEFLRFCVHNTNLYMVLATHQAMESGKQDPAYLLNYLSKNKLNIEYCRYIVDMNLISKLYGYYRFAGYYPYAKEKCISCTSSSRCACDRPARSFYTFCRKECNQAFFDCMVCKNWGSGYHVCEDFFWCDFCNAVAKMWPLQGVDL